MQRARRCWKLLADSNRFVLNSRYFTACSKRASSGLYCAISHEPTLNTGTLASRRRSLPAVLQCSSLKQDSRLRRIRRNVPDEIWSIVIVGKICVCLVQLSLAADFTRNKLTVKHLSSLDNIQSPLSTRYFLSLRTFPAFTYL